MVKHNNVIANVHGKKDWSERVRTWFGQPAQAKIRREKRQTKAARRAPRPAHGPLRPLVHCPTARYHHRLREGRGFSLVELKRAGIPYLQARAVGIAVDKRRVNRSEESVARNVARLAEYKQRLVLFPRPGAKAGTGPKHASKEEMDGAKQLKSKHIIAPAAAPQHEFVAITEDMRKFNAFAAVRVARADAKLVGKRAIRAAKKAAKAAASEQA